MAVTWYPAAFAALMHDVALSHILMSIHFSAPALLRCLRALYLWLSALMQCTAPNPNAAEHTLFVYLFVCLLWVPCQRLQARKGPFSS